MNRWSLTSVGLGIVLAAAVAPRGPASAHDVGPAGQCAPSVPVPGATEGASLPGTVAHSTGDLRAAQLLVDFADAPARYSVGEHRFVFGPADEWFRTVSYARLSLTVTSTKTWLRLPLR